MAQFITSVQTASGVVEVTHDGTLSDEEIIRKANQMQKQKDLLKPFETPDIGVEAPVEEEPTEENLLADIAQSVTRIGAGPVELARDVVNTAGSYLGATGDIISDDLMKNAKASFIDALFMGQVDPKDVIDEDTGEYKETTTVTGDVLNVAPYLVGTGVIKQGVSKALPKLSEYLQYGISGVLADQALYAGDGVLANQFVDPEAPDESIMKDVIEFMAVQEDDTVMEERLKVTFEGLAWGGALGLFMKPFTMASGLVLKGTPNEQAEQALEALRAESKNKRGNNQNVHADLKFSETPETVAQIEQQRSNPIMRFARQMFTSRGYWTTGAYNAVRGKEYAERQVVKEAENIANRLKISLDRLDYDIPEQDINQFLQSLNLSKDLQAGVITRGKFYEEAYDIAKKFNIPNDAVEELINARQLIDSLSARLMNSNIPNEQLKEIIESNVGQYINRSYRQFEDTNFKPDENLKEQVVQKIARSFDELLNEEGLPLSERELARRLNMTEEEKLEEALSIVNAMLDKRTDYAGLDHYSKAVRLNRGILQGKKDIDDDIRALLGEITNPSENIVLTVSKLANLVENNEFASNLLQAGKNKYFFSKQTTKLDANGNEIEYNVPISGTNTALDGFTQKFEVDGEMKQKTTVYYTTPEMAAAIAGRQSHFELFDSVPLQTYAALKGGSQAMKTVASHITHLRNMLGGLQFGLANGINPFFGGANSFEVLVNSARAQGDAGLDELYERYLGLGVINTNVKVNEFRRLMQEGADFGVGQNPKNFFSRLSGFNYGLPEKVAQPIKGALGKTYKGAENLYMAVDDFYKINAFERELATLKKARPKASAAQLEKEAAQIVQNTFPNYDKVPNGIKAFRYMPIGSFVSFPAEIIRTSGYIMTQGAKEILSGNPHLMLRGTQRLAGFGASLSAWDYLAEKGAMLSGLTQEEKEAVQKISHTPWSKAKRIPFRDENGQLFAADTQFLNSYSLLQEPARELLYELEEGRLKEEDVEVYVAKALFAASTALLKPFTEEAIFVDALTDVGTAFGSMVAGGDGRTSEGKQLFARGRLIEGVVESFGLLAETMLPGSISGAKGLYEANLFDLRGREATRAGTGTPKKDLRAELLANLTGIKFSKIDPADIVYYNAQNYSRLEDTLESEKIDSEKDIEEIEKIAKTNVEERYKAQQDLYLIAQSAIDLVGYGDVYRSLSEHMGADKAASLLSNMFTGTTFAKRQFDNLSKSPNLPEEITEALSKISEDEIKYRFTPLIPVDDVKFKQELLERSRRAKGGEVKDVPQVPEEPDERIDKMTGLPYNQQAGVAFMDEEDPERRLEMQKGGMYTAVSNLIERGAKEFFGIDSEDLRRNEEEAKALVNRLIDEGKLPERERVKTENGRTMSGDVFNAANHMFLAKMAGDSKIKRAALQGKEYIQQAAGDVGPHGAIGDRENNSRGFKFYDQAKGDAKAFENLVAENLVNRFGKNTGGITRRLAIAKGGKIDKKKMACNKPRRTPNHPKKSHVVKACKDGKEKIIRFGEQGAKTAGKPKAGESARMKAKRKSFKARHRKNIKRGKMSAAYWADKVKW